MAQRTGSSTTSSSCGPTRFHRTSLSEDVCCTTRSLAPDGTAWCWSWAMKTGLVMTLCWASSGRLSLRSGKDQEDENNDEQGWRPDDPEGLQAPRGGGLPDRRGVAARGEGEVDSARTSEHAAPVVGAATAGVEPRCTARAAVAGPVRSALPDGVQGAGAEALAAGGRLQSGHHGPGPAQGAAQVHRGLCELG